MIGGVLSFARWQAGCGSAPRIRGRSFRAVGPGIRARRKHASYVRASEQQFPRLVARWFPDCIQRPAGCRHRMCFRCSRTAQGKRNCCCKRPVLSMSIPGRGTGGSLRIPKLTPRAGRLSGSCRWRVASGNRCRFLKDNFRLRRRQPLARWTGGLLTSPMNPGRDEVYVRGFPSGEGKWLISANGGTRPSWRRDGRELFYMSPEGMLTGRGNHSRRLQASGRESPRNRYFRSERPVPLMKLPRTEGGS